MFTDPIKNLKALGLRENDIIADLGAGTGFYSVAAGALAPRGKVYTVEIVKDFLMMIKNKVKEAHLNNVEIIWGDVSKLCGTGIGDGIIDIVIASNIFFQVEDKEQFILEIKRILKKEGRVLLIDWSPDFFALSLKMAISKNKMRELFEKKGFIFEREINAGAHHYGIILVKGK